ncbi:MAG: FHA domain-containing protein [Gammaproteobacteria bacterium]
MHWRINVQSDREPERREYCFGQAAVRVGRADDVEIRLANADVSRVHFTLSAAGGRVRVDDSSRNGTFVRQGRQWTRLKGATELAMPARLRAGDWTFEVEAAPLAPATPEPAAAATAAGDICGDWEQSIMLPPGHVGSTQEAILVFDLCESSLIANQDDHMAYHLKQRLMQIAEPVLEQFGCGFFKSTGDGFLATFSSAAAALDAAVALEQRIQQRNQRTRNEHIHYRVALHFGEVWKLSAGTDDIHGNDVNIAFRIEGVQADAFTGTVSSLPRRDRILSSRAFLTAVPRERLAAVLSGHVQCGEASLKGITDGVVIHWLRTPYSGTA